MKKHWIYRSPPDEDRDIVAVASQLGITPLLALVLWQRGLTNVDSLQRFLDPGLRHLANPSSWPGLSRAASLLVDGLEAGKKLAVWGDYDVDGVTATALVLQVLAHHGFKAEWHLPDRGSEGYGLNAARMEALAAEGVTMLLTVDCGISDVQAVARAKELGMTVLVSDHHLPPDILPPADALCNPKLGDCPCDGLAGVGVAFFLMAEVNSILAARGKARFDMRETLDLVALGSLADMVPLAGQNRILVKNGLLKIAECKRPGLAALKVISGYHPLTSLGAGQVVFSLAPRINAAGRMADAALALELLRCTEQEQAEELARQLDRYNTERRQEEERITEEARVQAEAALSDPALVLVGDDWNQGVIGIVASRMVELYYKPTLILCRDGDALKGSGRSIREFDLHTGLAGCAEVLLSYGGHRMAAGLRMDAASLGRFRELFQARVRDTLGEEPVKATLILDADLDFAQASDFIFLKELELMQPFGIGNPEPVFASPPLTVRKRRVFGYQRNHVSLELFDESSGVTLHAKAWRQAESLPVSVEGKRIRIAYSPSLDMYNGATSVDIRIRDMEFL